jgi:hypothetical protein
MPRDMGGFVIISDAEIQGASHTLPPLQPNSTSSGSEAYPSNVIYHIYTDLRNKVRKRVEKYFFDTPETATTVDISTFIEGEWKLIHEHLSSL